MPDRLRILVLHGPNLNLLRRREPHIYGTATLEDINERLRSLADDLGVDLEIVQSNHGGALLYALHERIDTVQGCLLNPAALTQHSVGLYDAIKAMPFPSWRFISAISTPARSGAAIRSSARQPRRRCKGLAGAAIRPHCAP